MNLQKSMRVAMAMRGMNQGDLSDVTRIHRSNISKMVGGKMIITHEKLQIIAWAVGMKVSEFVRLGED